MYHTGRSARSSVCVIRMKRARTGGNAINVAYPPPSPSATGPVQVRPSSETSTRYSRGCDVGAPGVDRPPTCPGDSNWTSLTLAASGNSSVNHMPEACGTADDQPDQLNAALASSALWLAVAFHEASGVSARGSEASSSATVHGFLRGAPAVRTRATSAGVIT